MRDDGKAAGPGERIRAASWLAGAIAFERAHWRSAQASRTSSDGASHRIVLTEQGGTGKTTVYLEGRQQYRGRDWPQALSFVPAGVTRRTRYADVDLTYCVLRISPQLARDLYAPAPSLAPLVNGRDPVIACLLADLGRDLCAGRPPGTAYLEHLAALVLQRLAGLPPLGAEGKQRRVLDARRIKQVDEHIRSHLGEDICVAALAALCGMRPDTFARQFRAATGTAPYAYTLARRIEQAQLLLRTQAPDLARLAADLGFASQSHFTVAFHRIVGVTPGAYRARHRP